MPFADVASWANWNRTTQEPVCPQDVPAVTPGDLPAAEAEGWKLPVPTEGGWEEVTTAELKRRLTKKKDEVLAEHKRTFLQAPLVALMLRSDAQVELPPGVQLRSEGRLRFHGTKRRLLVVHLTATAVAGLRPEGQDERVPVQAFVQLQHLEHLLRAIVDAAKAPDGPCMWPVYLPKLCDALRFTEEAMVAGIEGSMDRLPLWKRVLYWFRIYIPPGGGPFLRIMEQQTGPEVTFGFARNQFFAQQLWVLGAFCLLWVCIGSKPESTGGDRVKFEICKLFVVLWGIFVAFRKQEMTDHMFQEGWQRPLIPNPHYEELDSRVLACWRTWGKMFLIGAPVLIAFTVCVNLTVLGATQLIIYEAFVWGDCAHLDCADPQVKHGFWGWVAEVGTDVLLAILFELFFAVGEALAEWLASLRNHKYEHDHNMSVKMLNLVLAAIERISTFGVMAFVFAPQWEEPPAGDSLDLERPCDDLIFGDGSLFCLQRRLPAPFRREIVRRLLHGPFFTAVFVKILVKVFAPKVAEGLDLLARRTTVDCWRPAKAVVHFVTRVLALIFSHDGDSVGCLDFIRYGWPFSDVVVHGSVQKEEGPMPWEELAACAHDATAAASRVLGTALGRVGALGRVAWSVGGKGKPAPNPVETPEQAPVCAVPVVEQDVAGAEMEQKDLLLRVLDEGVRKPFQPAEELLDIEMSFLWIVFFAQMFPIGVLTMLLGRVTMCKTNMAKLLYAQRRIFPEPSILIRAADIAFVRAAAFGAVGWSAGLTLMTYNDSLWRWNWGARAAVAVIVTLWLIAASGIAMAHSDRGWLVVTSSVGVVMVVGFLVLAYFENRQEGAA